MVKSNPRRVFLIIRPSKLCTSKGELKEGEIENQTSGIKNIILIKDTFVLIIGGENNIEVTRSDSSQNHTLRKWSLHL